MINMIGIGPFITIPLLMTALGGPQAMLGWLLALIIVMADGMVWSELGAAMPGAGGSFTYLRVAFGEGTFGRLMAFLFVWQFILSGPLEIASGYIGFSHYLGYLWPGLSRWQTTVVHVIIGGLNVALLYRGITSIARITVALWVGTMIAVAAVVMTGALHFDPALAFDLPPNAFSLSIGFFVGLGAAARVGIYDYLGYYNVCYIGDEVEDAGRVIPRSIAISTIVVAVLYLAINLSVIGVVSWRDFVPASAHPESDFVVSFVMERAWGRRAAVVFTLLILWTAFASVFALLLGYSRIPYAAARDGYFFKPFARLHPTGGFPDVSLVVLGGIAMAASLLSLGVVIDVLIVTRILVQFIGQVAGLIVLRRTRPDMPRPYRMWLYPVPAAVALVGWLFLFATTDARVLALGVGVLVAGVLAFAAWSRASATARPARPPSP